METVAEETTYIPAGYWLDNPDDYFLIGEVQEVTNVLNMLAIVALVVSGFLVSQRDQYDHRRTEAADRRDEVDRRDPLG